MSENYDEISLGYRLEDQIAKRKKELEKVSKTERENPFKGEPSEKLGKQKRIDLVFQKDVIEGFFFFAKTYYSEYTTSEFADFHRELAEIYNTRNGEFHLFAGPPEHGKSIISGIWKVYCGIRGLRHLWVQICENKTIAKNNISWVKQEFELNWKLVADFGELTVKNRTFEDIFAVRNYDYTGKQKEADNPYTGFAWLGHKGTLKGIRFFQYRVECVEFDDYEPIAASKNKELVEDRENWIFSEVEGRTSKDSVMVWLHNNSRKGSCADKLHENQSGREGIFSHKVAAHDGEWNPVWPQHWTAEALKAKMRKVGSITWKGDWMQEPIIQGKIFKAEWMKRYREVPHDLIVLGRIDFSAGSSKSASFKAIALLGYSPSTRRYYIVDAWVRQSTINSLIDACYFKYDHWRENGLMNIKIEKDFQQDLIYNPYFTLKEQEKGYRVPIGKFEVKGQGDKDARVSRLESPFELGLILWPHDLELDPDMNELYSHVLAWDYGMANKRLDGADALASAYNDLYVIARAYANDRSGEYETVVKGDPKHL
ncbi:MAG: hypothetical protein JJ958_06725 [Balneola sp.]|nr:hypothetical protein [Balneola sp.]